MFKDNTLQTTWSRALKAVAVGAAVGATVVAGFMLFALFRDFGANIFFNNAVMSFITSFAGAYIVWGIGILIVGAPIWIVLHKVGLRTWPNALIIGFALPFTVFFLVYANQMFGIDEMPENFANSRYLSATQPVIGWGIAAATSGIFGTVGSLVALTIWRIAYRRPTPC